MTTETTQTTKNDERTAALDSKLNADKNKQEEKSDETQPKKRGRGRPKGSTNKKRQQQAPQYTGKDVEMLVRSVFAITEHFTGLPLNSTSGVDNFCNATADVMNYYAPEVAEQMPLINLGVAAIAVAGEAYAIKRESANKSEEKEIRNWQDKAKYEG